MMTARVEVCSVRTCPVSMVNMTCRNTSLLTRTREVVASLEIGRSV